MTDRIVGLVREQWSKIDKKIVVLVGSRKEQ